MNDASHIKTMPGLYRLSQRFAQLGIDNPEELAQLFDYAYVDEIWPIISKYDHILKLFTHKDVVCYRVNMPGLPSSGMPIDPSLPVYCLPTRDLCEPYLLNDRNRKVIMFIADAFNLGEFTQLGRWLENNEMLAFLPGKR